MIYRVISYRLIPATSPSTSSGGSDWRERQRCWEEREESDKKHREGKRRGRWVAPPLLALSWMVTLKDILGIERVTLDKDPIKDKIKQVGWSLS